jgi:hypothetical protein
MVPNAADPRDAEKVRALLASVDAKLDSDGLVLEPELRTRITRAHAEGGMLGDAVVYVVRAPPASAESLEKLRRACRESFGADLPPDYLAFLERYDGMTVCEASREEAVRYAEDPTSFADEAVMSTAVILDWLEAYKADVTHPDGRQSIERPGLLPFYEIASEVGYHAFDFSSVAASPPGVIDVSAERLFDRSAKHDVLAPCFARWLEGFFAAGCEPFAVREHVERAAKSAARKAASKTTQPSFAGGIAPEVPREPDVMLPLVLRRSKTGIVILTIAMVGALATIVFLGGGSRIVFRIVIVLAVLVYCVKRVMASRHLIEIDEEGVLDSATGNGRIAWREIVDVGCEATRGGGALILTLEGSRVVRIDLDGVRTPIQTVISSAIAYLHAAKAQRARGR